MKITAIKQQLKNPGRASVFVDGKYAFSLNLDQLLEARLKIGQQLEDSRLADLKKRSAEGKLKMRALNWLMLRPHSEHELRQYLRRKKADQRLINDWAEDFKAKNYLNDEDFARWWVETRRLSKLASSRKLIFELRRKGINSEIIKTVIGDSNDDEHSALLALVNKKRQLARYRTDERKLTEYLLRQGFSYGAVKAALKENLIDD